MDIKKSEVGTLLQLINSSRPVPSAGLSLAMTGALGAALMGLTAKVSLRKEGDTKVAYLEQLGNEADQAVERFTALGDADVAGYTSAIKGEVGGPEKAVEIPLEMAELALKLAVDYEQVVNQCYLSIKGDAWLGIELLKTCAKTGSYIALLNIHQLEVGDQTSYIERINRVQQELGVKCTPDGCQISLV